MGFTFDWNKINICYSVAYFITWYLISGVFNEYVFEREMGRWTIEIQQYHQHQSSGTRQILFRECLDAGFVHFEWKRIGLPRCYSSKQTFTYLSWWYRPVQCKVRKQTLVTKLLVNDYNYIILLYHFWIFKSHWYCIGHMATLPAFTGEGKPKVSLCALCQTRAGNCLEPPTFRKLAIRTQ